MIAFVESVKATEIPRPSNASLDAWFVQHGDPARETALKAALKLLGGADL
jgi:hypothetical protein